MTKQTLDVIILAFVDHQIGSWQKPLTASHQRIGIERFQSGNLQLMMQHTSNLTQNRKNCKCCQFVVDFVTRTITFPSILPLSEPAIASGGVVMSRVSQ